MKNSLSIVLFLGSVVFFSCKKTHNGGISDTLQNTDVYVYGTLTSQTPQPPFTVTEDAVYYKNGVLHNLSGGNGLLNTGLAFAIGGDDIYEGGGLGNAAYWVNGAQHLLTIPNVQSPDIGGIITSGGDIYMEYTGINPAAPGIAVAVVSGYTLNGAVKFSYTGSALGFIKSGPDIYLYGDTLIRVGGNTNAYAVYYKNGSPVHLENTELSIVFSMFISGNDVYAAGRLATQTNEGKDFYTPVYWKNGVRTVLTADGSAEATGIAVKGNDVYVVGYIANGNLTPDQYRKYNHATLWKNGVPVTLGTGAGDSFTTNIVLAGNDVYVGGRDKTDSTLTLYWKNGVPKTISINTNTDFSGAGILVNRH